MAFPGGDIYNITGLADMALKENAMRRKPDNDFKAGTQKRKDSYGYRSR